jgi:NitT/TauT family transport system substrate-binding protein
MMKKLSSPWALGMLLLAVLLGAASLGLAKPRPRTLTIGMTYIPNVQFAPWYVAQERGYFREEGLEVKFDYRMDIDALQLVAAGQLDLAVAGGDQVITARAQGIPVSYLLTLYAKFPPAIVAKADSGIKSPRDLIGKRIGLPLYGTNLLAIKAILKKAGVAESQVQLVDVGYTQIPSLTAGKVDAVVGFANNEPVKLRAAGQAVNVIASWDYLNLVGHGLVTGEGQLKRSPELLRKMVRATLKGMRYALAEPDRTFAICLKYLPELGREQQRIEKQVLYESLKLWENDYTRQHGLGRSDPKAWDESQRLMLELGLIKKATPVRRLLQQQFLEAR